MPRRCYARRLSARRNVAPIRSTGQRRRFSAEPPGGRRTWQRNFSESRTGPRALGVHEILCDHCGPSDEDTHGPPLPRKLTEK
jgi:hypothetical protein